MRHFDNVRARLRQQVANQRQLTGPIDDVDGQLGQPSFAGQVSGQYRGDQPRIDIASGQDQADIFALKTFRRGKHRRKAGGSRAFRNRLLNGNQHRDGAFDLIVRDENDIVDQTSDNFLGDLPWRLDRDTLGKGVAANWQILSFTTLYIDG